jgi:hypothetical protein
LRFAPAGEFGDTPSWDISFKRQFNMPPVVLVTACDAGLKKPAAPAVGMVRNISRYGFKLAARNSDCQGGNAAFYWVAFGCGLGCGDLPRELIEAPTG